MNEDVIHIDLNCAECTAIRMALDALDARTQHEESALLKLELAWESYQDALVNGSESW